MYLVVRKDVPLDLAAACPLAGGAVVECARKFAGIEGFAAWRGSQRKVALRADAEQLAELAARGDGVVASHEGEPVLLCLAPRLRSESGELLASLLGFSDARRPAEPTPPPAPDVPALTYVLAADLGMTMGKAMAQAGHGALMCADSRAGAWREWAECGRPGRLVSAGAEEIAAAAAAPGAVVVRDSGLTQVPRGSATVVCFAPAVGRS
jgi:peptidyl-tRNA hydrolase